MGSAASGRVREDYVGESSDVDLVIVVDADVYVERVRDEVLHFLGAEVFPVYGVNAYPIVLYKDESIRGLFGNMFIMSVHSEGGDPAWGEA